MEEGHQASFLFGAQWRSGGLVVLRTALVRLIVLNRAGSADTKSRFE